MKDTHHNIYDFSVEDSQNNKISLSKYKGKVLLIVNTASKCGFTSQYEGLESIYKEYNAQGFEVLAFPCNQFAAQENGDDSQIQSFCNLNFGVTFPIFKKIKVNGTDTINLYKFLKNQAPGLLGTKMIKWNFTKFLINQKGEVLKRYAPKVTPKDIEGDIKSLLKS